MLSLQSTASRTTSRGSIGEKETAATDSVQPRDRRRMNMLPAMRTILFTLIIGASVMVGFTNATHFRARSWQEGSGVIDNVDNTVEQDQSTSLSRLLNRVSPEALHHFLHELVPNTFKHGIYSSDHDAIEAVHAGNPELASTIVHLAVRQGPSGNDTTTSETPTSSTISTSDTTPSTTSTAEPATSTDTPTETTTPPQPTPTPSLSTTTTTLTSTSTPASTGTSEIPQTTETSEPNLSSSSPTSGSSSDVATSSTSTIPTTTTTPTPTSKTSTFTSTLPGGAVTTVTEVAVVTPGVPEQDASPSTSAIGNLQHGGEATNVRAPGLPFLAGLLLGSVVLA